MTTADDLQAAVVLGLEAVEVTQRQDGIRLGVIFIDRCDASVIVARAHLVAVPVAAFISTWPGQQLVVIEVDGLAPQAHPLELKHVRMR